MHFWLFTARFSFAIGDAGSTCPRNSGLNWFIPALVKSSVGSSCGTAGELGTKVCEARSTKKSMNWRRICEDESVMRSFRRRAGIREG